MTQTFEVTEDLPEESLSALEQKDETESLLSEEGGKKENESSASEETKNSSGAQQNEILITNDLDELIQLTDVEEGIDEEKTAEDENSLTEDHYENTHAEDICIDDYIARAAGEGYIPNEEEAKCIEEIDLKLKSLLTFEEYKSLCDSTKIIYSTGSTDDHSTDRYGEGDEGIQISTLKEIDRQLDDLARNPSETNLDDDEISNLVSESAKQLNQLREEGQLVPEVNDDVIKKLLSEIEETHKDMAEELNEEEELAEESNNEANEVSEYKAEKECSAENETEEKQLDESSFQEL